MIVVGHERWRTVENFNLKMFLFFLFFANDREDGTVSLIFLRLQWILAGGMEENQCDPIAARYYRNLFFSVAIIIGNESAELEIVPTRFQVK